MESKDLLIALFSALHGRLPCVYINDIASFIPVRTFSSCKCPSTNLTASVNIPQDQVAGRSAIMSTQEVQGAPVG